MTNSFPIPSPPPELVEQWRVKWSAVCGPFVDYLATQAARWGSDQELEACCGFIGSEHSVAWSHKLRTNRRPKSPSLKEQALKALHTSVDLDEFPKQYDTIRRAIEALPND